MLREASGTAGQASRDTLRSSSRRRIQHKAIEKKQAGFPATSHPACVIFCLRALRLPSLYGCRSKSRLLFGAVEMLAFRLEVFGSAYFSGN